MVQTDEERKEKNRLYMKKYRQREDVKARIKTHQSTPEYKAKKKAWDKKRTTTPEYKSKKKEYDKKYRENPEYNSKRRTPEYRKKQATYKREYAKRDYVKAKSKTYRQEYAQREDVKRRNKERRSTPFYKVSRIKEREIIRFKVLEHYSKLISDSDIPCCACCGINDYADFLDIDHIKGKKQMDSEPHLIKLGYSSKLKTNELSKWLVDNNFPAGFQILCKNCNWAKGMKKNHNMCPHEIQAKFDYFSELDDQSSFESFSSTIL